MKSIEDCYGKYMTVDMANKVISISEQLIPMLKMVRNERVHMDMHDVKSEYSAEALDWWENIRTQYVDYVRQQGATK